MQNLSLYQIAGAFPILLENEEISDEDKLKIKEELSTLLQQKSQNIIGYVQNMELTIEMIKIEEERLLKNRKNLENRITKFKEYVKDCMEQNEIKKIETPLGTLSIANNPISVEIINEKDVPTEYKTEIITTKIDKKAITDNFKETGEVPDGVKMITNKTSLRIK